MKTPTMERIVFSDNEEIADKITGDSVALPPEFTKTAKITLEQQFGQILVTARL